VILTNNKLDTFKIIKKKADNIGKTATVTNDHFHCLE